MDDYLSCAKAISNEHSIINNLSNRGSKSNIGSLFLASKSFSAGGVVVAASVNESPSNLFHAVTLINPYLDVFGTMSMTSGNDGASQQHFLTEHERDEFGDPISDERASEVIRNYCPLLNVNKSERQKSSYETNLYPPMLIVSAMDDENVPYYNNSVRYAFKVRDAVTKECKNNSSISSTEVVNCQKSKIGCSKVKNESHPVLLHIEKEGGHHLHGRKLDVSVLENCFLLGRFYEMTSINKE